MDKIFVTRKIIDSGLKLLHSNGYDVATWNKSTPPTQKELIESSRECVGLITMLSDQIDQELIDSCPKLKVISNYAVGFNNINVEHASKKGIAVGNTPGVLTDATADIAFSLLINLSRKMVPSYQSIKDGEWIRWEPQAFLGKRLKGKTIGIVGMGRIGQAMAKRCALGFDMKVIYTAQTKKEISYATQVDFEELLAQSDVISVHTPITPNTKNLFNKTTFDKMKTGSIFINTARGEIHNEDDLYQALISKKIWAAGLDVTNPEPMPASSPLLALDNVLITPHIGSADFETREEMSIMCAENIIKGLKREVLPGFVNPLVFS